MPTVSNPFSTGGGGTTFEREIQAGYVVNMLVGGTVPCLPEGEITSIRVQARQLGIGIDDMMVSLVDTYGDQHKLLAQITHKIAITESDDKLADVLNFAWQDYNNASVFNPNHDAIVLITGPIAGRITQNLPRLLQWAKYCESAAEYIDKVHTAKSASDPMREFLRVIRLHLDKAQGSAITDDELWRFIKVFHWLHYDLDQDDSTDRTLFLNMAQLAKNPNVTDSLSTIWPRITDFIARANPNSATITKDNLPDKVKQWFRPNESVVRCDSIERLRQHGQVTLDNIDDRIRHDLHIERSALISEAVDAISEKKGVLILGRAGIGKSALAKNVLERLQKDTPCFVFKSEEFNQPHVDVVLSSIGISDTIPQLSARFALLPRKVLFIESLERIFESNSVETIIQFLTTIAEDDTWRIVATCRIHSLNMAYHHLLYPSRIHNLTTLTIPPLDADDFGKVLSQIPSIAPLAANNRVAKLLRIPLYLKYASLIDWSDSSSTLTEQNFKDIIWQNVIKKRQETIRGLQLRREKCFTDIALRRARAMTVTVPYIDSDPEAIEKLEQDNIIIERDGGYAPAHDLFEDWALIRYIDEQYQVKGNDILAFFDALGMELAIRRSFRIWLLDSINEKSVPDIHDFISDCLEQNGLKQIWSDDIIIAVLQSENSGTFFQEQCQTLLCNDGQLLNRAMNLLRIACKEPNISSFKQFDGLHWHELFAISLMFLRPSGSGWKHVIEFIHAHYDKIGQQHRFTIDGVLSDWIQGLERGHPLPDEARKVGLIALHRLYDKREHYGRDDHKDLIRVVLRVCEVLHSEISELANAKIHGESCERIFDIFKKEALDFLYSEELCKHYPDIVVKLAKQAWYSQKPDYNMYSESLSSREKNFGLNGNINSIFFPASGLQGPFANLLQHNAPKGINFIIELLNRATLSYTKSDLDDGEPVQVYVHLNDGRTIQQWGGQRLWCLYRGTSVAPNILQSALMALENWLFGQIKSDNNVIEIFNKLLVESNNVAITSMLVSIATAYPKVFKKHALPLLMTREFYCWDTQRLVLEQSISAGQSLLGLLTPVDHEIHDNERKTSAQRNHRGKCLEDLTRNLQITEVQSQIFDIFDNFRSQLPPLEDQSEEDKTWRIVLSRIDLRRYNAQEDTENQRIILNPQELEQDLQQFQEQGRPELEVIRLQRLENWGLSQFKQESNNSNYFANWQEALQEAKEVRGIILQQADDESYQLFSGGYAYTAAIIARDHWDETSDEQKEWCRQVLLEAIAHKFNSLDSQDEVSIFEMAGSRPAATVIPLLLGEFDEQGEKEIRVGIAASHLHPSREVRWFAVRGCHETLWEKDPVFAENCLKAHIINAKMRIDHIPHFNNLYTGQAQQTHVEAIFNGRTTLLRQLAEGKIQDDPYIEDITLETHDYHGLQYAVGLIPPTSTQAYHQELHAKIFTLLIEKSVEENTERRYSSGYGYPYEFAGVFLRDFSRFILNQPNEYIISVVQLMMDNWQNCYKVTEYFVPYLFEAEDQSRNDEKFWNIWSTIAAKAFEDLNQRVDNRSIPSELRKIIRTLLFSDIKWKEDTTEWEPLTNNREFIRNACSHIGHHAIGFNVLVCLFKSAVGRVFLPDALLWLNKALQQGDAKKIFQEPNTRFDLEVLLRNNLLGRESEIRGNTRIRQATVALLDALINAGSSTGFQLRERFIMPLPTIL